MLESDVVAPRRWLGRDGVFIRNDCAMALGGEGAGGRDGVFIRTSCAMALEGLGGTVRLNGFGGGMEVSLCLLD